MVSTMKMIHILICIVLLTPVFASGEERQDLDYAQVIRVRAIQQSEDLWRFDVTVRHNDEGCQSNIAIPKGVTSVRVRAKCNVHGFGGREITVDLTRPEGEGYGVTRLDR